MSTFKTEAEFEEALIAVLKDKGWENEVIKNPREEDLLKNWANILFENNRDIDRLNDVPLTGGEMQQIIEQITELKTPLKLNNFINGKTVSIKRDNPEDKLHLGKEVSLKIYDRQEIAAGQSRYQIVQQPKFKRGSKLFNDRRGDLMLLINGMPVIHLELKRSGISVNQASNQIQKYSAEGIFTGLFSLVQVFVAMTPEETKYFANTGSDGKFNSDYFFNWADFNNEPMNDWKKIAETLISIPMAHELIGYYTVADNSDGILKVMRSYQYNAAKEISSAVAKHKWHENGSHSDSLGGFIWHTTGSGKTMTSFKSAQLIAQSNNADKVVFLMDRIELGTQSLEQYENFADDKDDVQATDNTDMLVDKLKNAKDILIVSSIQKMSNVFEDVDDISKATNSEDIRLIREKRVVFIIDEAHRSTFGDMLSVIKKTFSEALFFGFTGTPIDEENKKNNSTTSDIFGNELHRYTIADGIRDKNVLGFDPYKVSTFKDKDLRRAIALEKAKAGSEEEVFADEKKTEVYNHYMNNVPMAGYKDELGKWVKGIEDYIPKAQYLGDEHPQAVVDDIVSNWTQYSQGNKFHAIFATSSISEAIQYYRRFKVAKPDLKISALFDPNIDNDDTNNGDVLFKQKGLEEIMTDYNTLYNQKFDFARHAKFKKDLSNRLAHKESYKRLENDQQLDLLIVVNQMLTGFDSKWLNTLYIDKLLEYENIIQAFSRTNRLFGPNKPFGTIRYYRYPHTMERNIDDAVKAYSGDKKIGLFVDPLEKNLEKMNALYSEIEELFENAEIKEFEKLPSDSSVCAQFAKLFKDFNDHLDAANIQGFDWDKTVYTFEKSTIELAFDEPIYHALVQRYKELFESGTGEGAGSGAPAIPYDVYSHITEIDTGKIDTDYMNSRFEKYLRVLKQEASSPEEVEQTQNELHKSFASLSQEEQKYANILLHEIQKGALQIQPGRNFRDYITEYQTQVEAEQIKAIVKAFNLDEAKLVELMTIGVNEKTINEYGRLDDLKNSVDKALAKSYFEARDGNSLSIIKMNIEVDKLLRRFILDGGFELKAP
ncbi:putative type I restriction enzyme, R subunit [Lentisphaera araneosa HTCC2155]|uniref:Type I restriction enzyme endonuclease subunit n=1 Tax=Lentisphaera araneosa HTCC2155 TaxID=313628 RepID=A6DIK5_9BACT|nr:HsdR family type I site-specific deoxyribonuclease [Lentisphaera araneosa]EDM28291.1 putative type I restriction enzyme, R subunit [Lentisphaera araneosa HTCC2155]